jgi:hypothetical protein
MKKRGARDIPDFSSKKKGIPGAAGPQPRSTTQNAVPRERVIKPQSTSSKSGRRGQ